MVAILFSSTVPFFNFTSNYNSSSPSYPTVNPDIHPATDKRKIDITKQNQNIPSEGL
jgi:hypothetical protein